MLIRGDLVEKRRFADTNDICMIKRKRIYVLEDVSHAGIGSRFKNSY